MNVEYFVPSILTAEEYDRAAQEYLASLPLEHFMEATTQSTQREISSASFALLRKRRPATRYFGELLVQYFHRGRLRQVVPDNMLVDGELEDRYRTNFAVELEPFPPFWMLEYVSHSNKRKDYKDSFLKYEQELRVPYYLIFDPETQDLRLYRHEAGHYTPVAVNDAGRYAIPELDLEVGLIAGWARYWYQGDLLGIPVELEDQISRLREQLATQGALLERKDEQLQQKDEQLQQKDEQLQQKDEQLQQKDQRLRQLLDTMRLLVEERARRAGRSDILTQLPTTTDEELLARWLSEI